MHQASYGALKHLTNAKNVALTIGSKEKKRKMFLKVMISNYFLKCCIFIQLRDYFCSCNVCELGYVGSASGIKKITFYS